MTTFTAGDIVVLKTGSAPMTVLRQRGGVVFCSWSTAPNVYCEDHFRADRLIHAPTGEAIAADPWTGAKPH